MKLSGIIKINLVLPMVAVLTILSFNIVFAEASGTDLYLANLNGQIEGFSLKAEKEPDSYLPQLFLSQLWYEKSGYSGNPYDTAKAIDHSNKALELALSSNVAKDEVANLYLLRARQNMRLHKFLDAKNDLSKAQKLGASTKKVQELMIDLSWNQGDYKNSLKWAKEELLKAPHRLNLIHLAGLEHELGNWQSANNHYQSARSIENDGLYFNPIQLAWLDVQIGVNFFKMEDYPQAELAFRAALKKAPDYTMALEHLAECLAQAGRTQEATTLYEKIVRQSDDPEFMGQLAKLYRLSNKIDAADQLAAQAKEKYQKLLKDFPEAMYWHASEFFLGEGNDPKLALKLLQKNVQLRSNSSGYLALAKAQVILNQKNQAKQSIIQVLKMPPISDDICQTARELLKKNNPLLIGRCRKTTNSRYPSF
jgi:tetratricopeptide (TPR) repeat protein